MLHLGFMSSLFLSRLADQIILFLVPLVIFQLTSDAALSGFAFFVETLPRFIAFPICGILTDFYSPYRLLSRSQLARFIVVLLALVGYFLLSQYLLVGWCCGDSGRVNHAGDDGARGYFTAGV